MKNYTAITMNWSDDMVNTISFKTLADLLSWMRLMAVRNMSAIPFKAVVVIDNDCQPIFVSKRTEIVIDKIGGDF